MLQSKKRFKIFIEKHKLTEWKVDKSEIFIGNYVIPVQCLLMVTATSWGKFIGNQISLVLLIPVTNTKKNCFLCSWNYNNLFALDPTDFDNHRVKLLKKIP